MATTIPESHRDLLQAQFATLATVRDGRPEVTELWFPSDGDAVRMSFNTARRKVKNLQRTPACSLLILDLANPLRYLKIRGDAEIEPDSDYTFADKVGAKYDTELRTMDQPGESRVIVTIRPSRVRVWG